ncbi:MAG: hypothetical protein O8C63_02635 [Candidatus Methanoperedens sp.]|nr:hypothetical protein [Candidatus Methanoperedens sp.]
MVDPESSKTNETKLKLKAKMVTADEQKYTLQVYPINVEWQYLEPESVYRIDAYSFKNDSIKKTVRDALSRYQELMIGSIKVGSKEYLFEVQIPKGFETNNIKQIFTHITDDINNEISRYKNEIKSFTKFLEETEF